jgi:hypothetical protein
MAASSRKRIHEYQYCGRIKKQDLPDTFRWLNAHEHSTFYGLINDRSTFEETNPLYLLTENNECESLRKLDYLTKVASAIAHFGERYIISSLNFYCRRHINEPARGGNRAYRVPHFKEWKTVRSYIGNRQNQRVPYMIRVKMERVYARIRVIAEEKGISGYQWDILSTMYEDRNTMCHPNLNIADLTCIQAYTGVTSSCEREGVNRLCEKLQPIIQTMRRTNLLMS